MRVTRRIPRPAHRQKPVFSEENGFLNTPSAGGLALGRPDRLAAERVSNLPDEVCGDLDDHRLRMLAELRLGVEVEGEPTVGEVDGAADLTVLVLLRPIASDFLGLRRRHGSY